MAFTSWADELARFKNALADRNIDSFWVMSTENSREMKTVYTRLNNIQDFISWLEMKASNEALTDAEGRGGDSVSILLSVGGS